MRIRSIHHGPLSALSAIISGVLASYAAITFGLLIQCTACAGDAPRTNLEELALRLAAAAMGRIQVAGAVVDEAGKPVKSVAVDIVRPSPTLALSWTNAPSTLNSSASVDGAFHFTFESNNFITLTFRKDGYFPEEKVFTITLDESQETAVLSGAAIETPVLLDTNVTVTLRAISNAAALVTYTANIECNASGSRRILDFGLWPNKALSSVTTLEPADQLPRNSVSLQCATNGGGAFDMVQITTNTHLRSEMPFMTFPPAIHSVPRQVRLVMTSGDDGFCPYEPAGTANVFRQMRVAPRTGYQRELVIDGRYFVSIAEAETTEEDEELFFFFRSGGRYGKGFVRHVYLDGKSTVFSNAAPRSISVGVMFGLQPDGSRNVVTRD